MKIINFEQQHIEQAKQIAIANYNEERVYTHILPTNYQFPEQELYYFAKNGLGVAAFEGEQMLGFLCCYRPHDNAFDSMAIGTFSPIHAHGAIKENREKIYKKMYQVAAEKWVKEKIAYHAIAFYAHDKYAINAFYTYGLGLRCIDAIRPMEPIINTSDDKNITYQELKHNEIVQIRGLRKLLAEHFRQSPIFMYSSDDDIN